jgi:hypothetical protein
VSPQQNSDLLSVKPISAKGRVEEVELALALPRSPSFRFLTAFFRALVVVVGMRMAVVES